MELNEEQKREVEKQLIKNKLCPWCHRYYLSIESWYKVEEEPFVKVLCNWCGHLDVFTTVPIVLRLKKENE